ncbi:aminoacetone oxidase family FAD-binding enzyme [Leptospira perolatii]|uniref:Aminoacetone oxidase family FAD-binding enzyme n=1 Tax=Leptospira perolatii TaxID=2023191 RepID=A0A2M9ZIL1_9LEPT|nr:NAD(P)/FAD-dependent oxidoreductase [Leptospira perolatii]PJZ68474.1 aminoacetone oxidase family FAD-binding enzyme [Leptospira perolatii]PJZ71898.1 aminoacetone oxidase family FAD-binding enzyme [Leptospira perolatii]
MHSNNSPKKVAIIGGGAAGFFSAIHIRKLSGNQVGVVLFEKSPNILTKVRISGGGRCNVTHSCFSPEDLAKNYPRGGKELRYAFELFQPKDTIDWFSNKGVKLKTELDGRIFPVTDNSETIVNCLLGEAKSLNVSIRTKVPITGIYPAQNGAGFIVKWEGNEENFDKVLIASGSSRKVWEWAANLGHKIEPPVPSLFTFEIDSVLLEGLSGLSVSDVEISLPDFKLKQRGPLLVTHWGLSGPAVLKLSAWGARELFDSDYRTTVLLDLIPNISREDLRSELQKRKLEFPNRKPESRSEFGLPSRLWERLWGLVLKGEKRWSEVSSKDLHEMVESLKRYSFQMKGKGLFKEEFVTCGGVRRKEINFQTMESKIIPGLYFAGEALDIDGITGGFNFQNAWTTGYIAALGICGLEPMKIS